MARDITVHFVGNARDLAASSAVAEASVDRFGNATAIAGAKAEVASFGFAALLAPLIAIAAAVVVATAPITVLATTFGLLAGGIVGLPLLMGFLGDEVNDLMNDIRIMASTIATAALPMAQQFLAMLTPLIPVVTELGLNLIQWFGERLPMMLPIVISIVQAAAGMVLGFAAAWGHLVDFFMSHWGIWMASLKSLFDQIGTGIHFVTPLLGLMGAMFQALGPVIGFVRDHADSLKPILYAVGGLLVVMAVSAGLTAAALLLLVAGITAVAAGISFAITHIHAVADAFWAVVHAVEAAISAIGRVRDAIASVPVIGGALHFVGVPGFQEGGVVPGPLGAPMLAMVHGGETITPPGWGGGATYNVNVSVSPLASPADVGRQVVQAIQEYERRGSKSWRQ